MRKNVLAAIPVLMLGGAIAFSQPVSAQPGAASTGGPCKMRCMKPDDRLMRMGTALGLTEEQKKKIKPVLDEETARIKEIHAATYERINAILTPEQRKKHDEMRKYGRGPHHMGYAASPAARLDRMSGALNLTDEQKMKIKPVLEGEAGKMKALHDDTSLTRQQKRDKARAMHAGTYEQIKPILTPEQQKKHEEMVKQGGKKREKCAMPPQ